jgi:hypothetical protein
LKEGRKCADESVSYSYGLNVLFVLLEAVCQPPEKEKEFDVTLWRLHEQFQAVIYLHGHPLFCCLRVRTDIQGLID